MPPELSPQDFQTQVLTRLDRIEARLDQLETDIRATVQRVDKWEERFLQLSRDNLAISRTVIIAAAAAVIFAPLIKEIAPAVAALIKPQ
ncbi:MAG: hypothetical protein NZL92_04720 [Gloeomargarita sp. SKYG116]|nr:hypothetical protein [Gloeomargarita sp. SKYG116]MCS7293664.1 hypothetical protein [Gloeomargarita sp. SKYB120]MDW8179230.1 hypothetical protein [Gloeomargarita sp. SKYBB_i_bin120]MDW8400978.1 hypothetical protein [Gloeomargarita sp. SKYGB_i_bin116]